MLVVSIINTFSQWSKRYLNFIVDILIVGKVGHDIIIPGDETYGHIVGDHGYDNRAESMHPILYAFGPAFYQNLLAEPFRSVDLYPLMSHVLHLKQRPTNGSLSNVKHILVDFRPELSSTILGNRIPSIFHT